MSAPWTLQWTEACAYTVVVTQEEMSHWSRFLPLTRKTNYVIGHLNMHLYILQSETNTHFKIYIHSYQLLVLLQFKTI